MSARYQERLASIEKVLLIDKQTIDLTELRNACTYGIPEPLRPLAWRLLLNYLPIERQQWKEYLRLQRENYNSLVDQLIVEPGRVSSGDDHPLSDNSNSEWGAFFEDNRMLTEIDKDVRRLCPEIQFFQLKTKYPHKSAAECNLTGRVTGADLKSQEYNIDKTVSSNVRKQATEQYKVIEDRDAELHWQVVERILFIYAKLNPGVKYVQGMNEVLGPIYYALASDPDQEWAEFAEADAFFCFQQLMSEIKDVFIKTLDQSSCGIESTMTSFYDLLSWFDPQLYAHMVTELNIKPQFYAFRWLSLLLSQEFPLPDVITIWDSLFSDPSRFSLLPYVCLAMLEFKRDYLLSADFADTLRLLQNYPDIDVSQLVSLALSIRDGGTAKPAEKQDSKRMNKHTRTFSDKIKELGSLLRK